MASTMKKPYFCSCQRRMMLLYPESLTACVLRLEIEKLKFWREIGRTLSKVPLINKYLSR